MSGYPDPEAERRPDLFPGSPLEPLAGSGDESWVDLVRRAEEPSPRGRLGPYDILAESRGGGQGVVFRARQPGTDRDVALKRLSDGVHSSPEMRRRFEREIETVTGLSHPGIVTVYGVEIVDDLPVLAMEWIDGEPLTEWASRVRPGSRGVREKLAMFAQVCEAVQHAHQNGVIHRDLKPSNILVDDAGRARVLDFGLARRVSAADPVDVTRTLGFVGTPAYAAPEQFTEGAAPLDVRSDVYALGVVLYEMLAGRRPFVAERLRELLEEIEAREPPRPSSLMDCIDSDLDAVIAKAMAKQRDERYQTVDALADDIRRYLARRPVLAAPQSARYLLAKWMRRNRLASTLAAACAALVAGSVAFGAWHVMEIAAERDEAQAQRRRAENEVSKARAVQDFYLDAIMQAATPYNGVGSTDVIDVLEDAAGRLDEHFPEHPDVAIEIRARIAHVFTFVNRLEDAEQLVMDAQERLSALAAPAPAAGALLHRSRGELLGQLGRNEEAAEALTKAAEIYRTLEGAHYAQSLASCLSTLGAMESDLGRAEAAERHLRESLRISEVSGTEHATLMKKANLASVLIRNGALDEAEAMLRAAYADAEQSFDAGDLLFARITRSMALVHWARGDHARALRLRKRSLGIYKSLYPADHPKIASETWTLARYSFDAGHYEKALARFGDAAGFESASPRVRVASLRGAAQSLAALDRLDEAASQFRDAWADYREVVERGSPGRVEMLIEWLAVLVRAGQHGDAKEVFGVMARELREAPELGPKVQEEHRALLRRRAAELGLTAAVEQLLGRGG